MKKFKFPLRVPAGTKIIVSQRYGDTKLVEWYKKNGILIDKHNGDDIVIDYDRIKTYGTAIVNPFPNGSIAKFWFDNPMSTKGNGLLLQSNVIEDEGIFKIIQFLAWHCSEVVTNKMSFAFGEDVGYIGNSGLVSPSPTPSCAYCGSHLHVAVFEHHLIDGIWILQKADNGVGGAQSMLDFFDINDPFIGEDTPFDKDLPPIIWLLEKILGREAVDKWLGMLKGRNLKTI